MDGWKKLYGNMIEWVPGKSGGKVSAVDTKTMTVMGELDKFKGAVVNVIPAQTAGGIAIKAGLANESGFCAVDPKTFESKIHKGIHVIGDASIAGALPKSGFAANSEAKICASAIAAMLKGEPVPEESFVNTCYSLVGPTYGISVAGVYRISEKGITEVPGSGGVSRRKPPTPSAPMKPSMPMAGTRALRRTSGADTGKLTPPIVKISGRLPPPRFLYVCENAAL